MAYDPSFGAVQKPTIAIYNFRADNIQDLMSSLDLSGGFYTVSVYYSGAEAAVHVKEADEIATNIMKSRCQSEG